jgi:glycosyltransferase involved in cell wall biosynthesis
MSNIPAPLNATKTPDSPLVSIIICTHNYGRYLDQALTSAARQTHACELIVVDDGSTDETRTVLEGWRDRAKIIHQSRGGQRSAYETGFRNSTGDYVIFLDADDRLIDTAVGQILNAFTPDVVKVHCRMRLVDEYNRPLGPMIPSRLARGDVATGLARWGLMYASAPGSGNAYRRSAIAPLFPLPADPFELHGADYFLIYGCVFAGQVAAIDAPLCDYRVHNASLIAEGSLVFGNTDASRKVDPHLRFRNGAALLRAWLLERTNGRVELPNRLLDFSQQKVIFVCRVFERAYFAGLVKGIGCLPQLLTSLWLAGALSMFHKLAISAWAFAVLLLPRSVGLSIARYVSNPGSRLRRPRPSLPVRSVHRQRQV